MHNLLSSDVLLHQPTLTHSHAHQTVIKPPDQRGDYTHSGKVEDPEDEKRKGQVEDHHHQEEQNEAVQTPPPPAV